MGVGNKETVGEVLMSLIKGERHLEDVMAPPSVAWNAFKDYIASIDWAAEWIWLTPLAVLEFLLLVFVILTRKNITIQTIIFLLVSVLLFLVDPINTYLMNHWTNFATQPLFDPTGSFICLVFAVPLTIVMIICIINFFAEIIRLLREAAIAKNKRKKQKSE